MDRGAADAARDARQRGKRVMSGRKPAGGAIVLGASYRSLGVVRSLGRQGIPVSLIRSEAHTIAGRSRYAGGFLAWPARAEDAVKIAHLLKLAERDGFDGWTLIPTDDETAALLSRFHATLSEHYVMGVPEWSAMRWAYDKRLTYQLGVEVGIDQPRTWLAQADGFETGDVSFPAVLKPAYKRERNRFTTEKAWPVGNRAELRAAYRAASELVPSEEIIVQELIPGGGECQLSYAALAQEGQVLASLAACRARQFPMDFGRESTMVYTIEAPDIEAASLRLIEGMRYSGLIEIEFKRDRRDGRPKLLDINPRIWGWQSIGPRAGVDFVALQWRLLHGETPPPARARVGVRWVRGSTDIPICAREMASGRLSPRAYAASLRRPLERAMFAADDPLPGLLDAPLLMLGALSRRFRMPRRRALLAQDAPKSEQTLQT